MGGRRRNGRMSSRHESSLHPPLSVPMSRKTVFKALGYTAGGLLALVLVALGAVYGVSSYRLHRKHVVNARPIAVPTDVAAIERGRHIVTTRACADCHGADFAGHKVID